FNSLSLLPEDSKLGEFFCTMNDDYRIRDEKSSEIGGSRKTTIIPDKKLPVGWSKHSLQRKHGNSVGKWDVFLVSPQGRKFRSRHELRQYFEETGENFKPEMFDFALNRRRSRNIDDSTPATPQRRVKTLLPKIRNIPASQSKDDSVEKLTDPPSPPPPYTTTVAAVPAVKVESKMLEGEVLVGGLKIQMDGNSYKCPKERCGKNFRKENLLQMHIKHYHPEYNKFMGSTPNVADLAYARTIGESIDDLMPKSRYSSGGSTGMTGTAYSEKMNRFETTRKNKSGVAVGAGIGKGGGGGGGGDGSPVPDKKKMAFKEKLQNTIAMKKAAKGAVGDGEIRIPMGDDVSEVKESSEERSGGNDNQEHVSATVTENTAALPYREEKKEPQTTIKTLLPVIRSPSHVQDVSSADRLKTKFPSVEEGEEYSFVINPQGANVTKSLRTIRRRRLSDFHFEPLHKRRKIGGAFGSGKSTPTYRYSRKKTPIVHLEKLNVTTDSNAIDARMFLQPPHSQNESHNELPLVARTDGSLMVLGQGYKVDEARLPIQFSQSLQWCNDWSFNLLCIPAPKNSTIITPSASMIFITAMNPSSNKFNHRMLSNMLYTRNFLVMNLRGRATFSDLAVCWRFCNRCIH
ncbi:hypothetical protein L9F63_004495, partial [Diploptera punctata]